MEGLIRTSLKHAERLGRLLLGVKEQLGHGKFIPWVEENCPFSPRSASGYMKLALESSFLESLANANQQSVADLTIKGALKLLAKSKIKADDCEVSEPEDATGRPPDDPPIDDPAEDEGCDSGLTDTDVLPGGRNVQTHVPKQTEPSSSSDDEGLRRDDEIAEPDLQVDGLVPCDPQPPTIVRQVQNGEPEQARTDEILVVRPKNWTGA
jgi:hypothetical protein